MKRLRLFTCLVCGALAACSGSVLSRSQAYLLTIEPKPGLEVFAVGYNLQSSPRRHRDPVKAPLSYLYKGEGFKLHFVVQGFGLFVFGENTDDEELQLDLSWPVKCSLVSNQPIPRRIDLGGQLPQYETRRMYQIAWQGTECIRGRPETRIVVSVEEAESKKLVIQIRNDNREIIATEEFTFDIINNGTVSDFVVP